MLRSSSNLLLRAVKSGVATVSQLAGRELSTASSSQTSSSLKYTAALGVGAGLAALGGAAFWASADEAEHGLASPQYPWSHEGFFDSFDYGAIRRGHQVYQQVCAACHSLQYIHYRDLVGICYTEEEAKAMAADIEVVDGPNDEGEMFDRPGKLSDKLPAPYANEQSARYANGGAYPPDLSLMTTARHDGQNYVFALLMGYREPPAGVSVREGLYYNPYFPGGAIAMPRMLNDGGVEYDDGTPSSSSQQAKDVTTFLHWCAMPEQDQRKQMGIKAVVLSAVMFGFAAYLKRLRWAPLKSRRIVVDVVN